MHRRPVPSGPKCAKAATRAETKGGYRPFGGPESAAARGKQEEDEGKTGSWNVVPSPRWPRMTSTISNVTRMCGGLIAIFRPESWYEGESNSAAGTRARMSFRTIGHACVTRSTSAISGRRTMLNRGVVIVRPKQPYLDWAAALDDSELVPDPNAEQTVYLIPSYGDDEEAWEILERVHPAIFENELYGWHTDEAAWPKGRDFAMFKAWFKIELHSVVEDLCDYEIVDEDAEA